MKITKEREIDDILMSFKKTITDSFLKESKRLGFSPTHFEILMYVYEKGTVTMKSIALWLNITPPSVSSLVDKLVAKKLVTRVSKDSDRRTIHIELGAEAHKLFMSLHKKKMIFFERMLSKLNKKEREDLVRILKKCIS